MQDAILRPFAAVDTGWLVRRHAALYARDDGFDASFGEAVAGVVAGFLAAPDPGRARGWIAEGPGGPLGSIFCTREDAETARLRLFLLEPAARGQGLGRHMLETCLGFARDAGYRRMTLDTHESHRAACRLYARRGFTLRDSQPVRAYGQELVVQRWDLDL